MAGRRAADDAVPENPTRRRESLRAQVPCRNPACHRTLPGPVRRPATRRSPPSGNSGGSRHPTSVSVRRLPVTCQEVDPRPGDPLPRSTNARQPGRDGAHIAVRSRLRTDSRVERLLGFQHVFIFTRARKGGNAGNTTLAASGTTDGAN